MRRPAGTVGSRDPQAAAISRMTSSSPLNVRAPGNRRGEQRQQGDAERLALPPVTERGEDRERADEGDEDEDQLERLTRRFSESEEDRHLALSLRTAVPAAAWAVLRQSHE